jgi:6-phosphogluconate dehydrogenase (decarboxylating)
MAVSMTNGGEFGVIGLGKAGGELALQALEKGFRVVGLSRDGAHDELKEAGLVEIEDLAFFRERLKPPRLVLLYIPAGRAVDDILDGLTQSLERGDIVADGGNSYLGGTRSAAIAAFEQRASNSSTWERPAALTALDTGPWSAAS